MGRTSAVTVFVDDAVTGHLPAVCAKTGERTDRWVQIDQARGGLGAAWLLLLLLGPIGWVVLAIAAVGARREVLSVRVPMSAEAASHERRLARRSTVAAAAAVLLVMGGLARLDPVPLAVWLAGAASALVVAVATYATLLVTRVGIDLDASRRWVTLSRVHPAFVGAVAEADIGRPTRSHTP